MVGPGGIRDPDGLGQTVAHHELGGDAQGTCTTRRLGCLGASAGDQGGVLPEQQLLHYAAIFDIAFNTEVVLGLLVGEQLLLGFLDAMKDRSGTGLILVDPDPQIDLVAARVGTEGFGQAQDRIRWGGNNLFKHGIPCIPLSSLAGKLGWQTKALLWRALRQLFIPLPSIGENRFLKGDDGLVSRWHASPMPGHILRPTGHGWTPSDRCTRPAMDGGSGSAPRGERPAEGRHRPP
ncbi:hypothetical protein D3C84_661300 [compost metagenome]